jgi:hypothetical protein
MRLSELHRVHAQNTWAYGLLPPTLNILSLLLASGVIASGAWLYTGTVAGLLGFLPVYAETVACMVGLTFANFWFSREIQTIILSIKEAESGITFANHDLNLRKAMKFQNRIINTFYKSIYKDKHSDLNIGRVGSFEPKDQGLKFVGVPGRNAGNSVYAISQAALNKNSQLHPRLIAAWMLKEQVKSYHSRGWSNLFVSLFESITNTLNSLQESEIFMHKFVWLLASPLQFFLLLPKMVKRGHEYEAWRELINMGYGLEAIEFLDIKSNPNRFGRAEPWVMIERREKRFAKREPYNGWFAFILRPFANWADSFLEKNEWAWDDKSDWRIFSVFGVVFLNIGRWVQELFADSPSGFNIKECLKKEIPDYKEVEGALKNEIKAALKIKNPIERKAAKDKAIENYKRDMAKVKQKQYDRQDALLAEIDKDKHYDLVKREEISVQQVEIGLAANDSTTSLTPQAVAAASKQNTTSVDTKLYSDSPASQNRQSPSI